MANSGYGTDITNQQAGNYAYDPIGNMVSDIAGGITGIAWTVYGKIQSVAKASSTVQYTYDASGNRISKAANGVETWYVRDATGNVMATYTKGDVSINSGNLTQAEVDLYGSSRLGLLNTSVNCSNNGNGPAALGNAWDATYNRGQKLFELTNHLGNVLATTTDRLVPVPDASGNLIDYYLPDVASATDYYSHGMQMPGRAFSAGNVYRYGFNGKENDRDISDGAQDYGMRVYDGRLAKFLSVDPLSGNFPWFTPYQFAGNTPIQAIDLDGEEPVGYSTSSFAHPGNEWIRLANDIKVESKLPGDWFKMQIKDPHGDPFTVYRQEIIGINMYGRAYTQTSFYFLDQSSKQPDNTNNQLISRKDGRFMGSVAGFEPQEVADAKAGAAFADNGGKAVFFTALGLAGGFAFEEAIPALTEFGTGLNYRAGLWALRNKGLFALGSSLIAGLGDPSNPEAGLESGILQVESNISAEAIQTISKHLEQFGARAENKIMLERLEKIANGDLKATEIDQNFVKHELREAELEAQGIEHDAAHEQVLKEQGMYHRGYEEKLYTKEALEGGNKQMHMESEGKQ